jgi:hypothetical protein
MKTNMLFYFAMALLGFFILGFLGALITGYIYHRPVDVLYKNISSNEYFNEFRAQYPNQNLQRNYPGFGVEYRVGQESNDFVLFQNAKTNELRLTCETHNANAEEAARRAPAESIVSKEAFKALITGEGLCKKDPYGIWILKP